MKRLLLAVLVISLLPTPNALAIPNPAATYCGDLGYDWEDGDCIFPDGTSCPEWDFYNGECGAEYAHNLECREAGEIIGTASCCEDLITIKNDDPGLHEGCAGRVGGWAICSDCGNNVCDPWENSCNCSEDCESTTFSDIDSYKYISAIEYVYNNGIVNGYNDGTYKPNDLINRVEFVKIISEALYNSADFNAFDYDSCFSDISAKQWYSKYVCFAKDKGIINGYPDGDFRPANNINYVEALKIIIEAYTKRGLMENVNESESDSSLWYYNYVKYANDMRLSFRKETNNDQLITRGEAAEIIRWMDSLNKE